MIGGEVDCEEGARLGVWICSEEPEVRLGGGWGRGFVEQAEEP